MDDIKTSMEYDVVIRYESPLKKTWEDVTVTIIRPGQVDYNGPCSMFDPADDVKHVLLPPTSRSVTVYPPACLEAGQVYKIRIDLNTFSAPGTPPTASVLIDSVSKLQLCWKLLVF